MAACCAIGALVIYKLMTIYSRLPQVRSAKRAKEVARQQIEEHVDNEYGVNFGPQTCRFSLHGLTCMSCVATVEKSLMEARGVLEVTVSLHSLSAIVTFDPKKAKPNELQSFVEDAGFAAQLNINDDNWKSQWTNAANSRQKSIVEWQNAFNRSVLAGILVFFVENLGPWMVGKRPVLEKLLDATANAITTVSILWLANSIHREAFAALRRGMLNTSTLSSAGLLCVLASASLQELLGQSGRKGRVPLTSACMLLTLTIGVKLIKCAVSKRGSRLATLLASALPDTASLLLDNGEGMLIKSVPVHLLRIGDTILIERGTAFPGDCVITEGDTSVLQTIVNGELDPVAVVVGDAVHAGSTNCGDCVRVKVLRLGRDTWLGHTLSAVSRATERKSEIQDLSDRFLDWFGTIVMLLATLSVVHQIMNGASVDTILNKTASILLCACPCTIDVFSNGGSAGSLRDWFWKLKF